DQMWVVHSLDAAVDLKPGDLRHQLLAYAQDHTARARAVERETRRTESEFEREVLRMLTGAGYRVRSQWPVGHYRIDLVVEGEDKRLAVECDGDRFHPIEKLAEDMGRQAVLERLGWTFERIRGSEFFRNSAQAMEPVFRRLRDMGIEPLGPETAAEGTDAKRSELVERIVRRAEELKTEWQQEGSPAPKETVAVGKPGGDAVQIRGGASRPAGHSNMDALQPAKSVEVPRSQRLLQSVAPLSSNDQTDRATTSGHAKKDPVPPVAQGQTALFEAPPVLKEGFRVKHAAFGSGTVIRMISKDKAEVLFDLHGKKAIHLGYASLRIVQP
ncbi:MAG: DUF559 domain-containing protein, partial [Pseudomonadota bacterium]